MTKLWERLVVEGEALAHADPVAARQAMAPVLDAATDLEFSGAHSVGRGLLVARALRANALAGLQLDEIDGLDTDLARARRLAQMDPAVLAAVHITTCCLYLFRGEWAKALREAETARQTDSSAEVLSLMYEAMARSQAGQIEEALAAYDQAIPLCVDWPQHEPALRNNRGNLLLESGRPIEALADFERALAVVSDAGAPDARRMSYLGHAAMAAARAGDAVRVFRLHQEMEAEPDGAAHDSRTMTDIADALNSASLFEESSELCESALTDRSGAVQSIRWSLRVAIEANAGLGDMTKVKHFSEQLLSTATGAGDGSAMAEARLFLSWAASDIMNVQQASDDLRTVRNTRGDLAADQHVLRIAASLLASDRPHLAVPILETVQTPSDDQPLNAVALAWLAIALREVVTDRPASARASAEHGLVAVEMLMAGVGSAELRVRHASLGRDLGEVGLGARRSNDESARGQYQFVLRTQARLHQLRQAANPELFDDLRQVRSLSLQQDDAALSGPELAGRIAEIERSVLLSLRATPSSTTGGSTLAPEDDLLAGLQQRLGPTTSVLSYQRTRDELVAFTVTADEVAATKIGADPDEIAELVTSLDTAVVRLASGRTGRVAAAARGLIRNRLDTLQRILVAPIKAQIPRQIEHIVVNPTGVMHGIPWHALEGLAHRTITVVPAATTWMQCRDRQDRGGSVDVVMGPNLREADRECDRILEHWNSGRTLSAGKVPATSEEVMFSATTAQLLHLACHGRFRADNPMFSQLELQDGPLLLADLTQVSSTPPLVILGSCQAAASFVGAADGQLGMAQQFLQMGARTVIAARHITDDAATADLMIALHERLAAGDPPATALAHARAATENISLTHYAAGLSFACVGAA